jgi:intracellular sulfur oxidation DsrE/DsrF family protein
MPAKRMIMALLLALLAIPVLAAEQRTMEPAKVVYDISSPDPRQLKNILDRVSLLQDLYGHDPFAGSIVIVLHEGVIPLFAKDRSRYQKDLVRRAQDLAMGEIIQFRLCQASARMQGFERTDFEHFIQVVPMADAEIVKLQHQGYAYLH